MIDSKEVLDKFKNIIYNSYIVEYTRDVVQPISLKFFDGKYGQKELMEVIKESIIFFALTSDEMHKYQSLGYNYQKIFEQAMYNISSRSKKIKGDYGELLLFLVLSSLYEAPKLITKVAYREPESGKEVLNFDCAHFTVDDEEKITMWLGEAKFHRTLEDKFLYKKSGVYAAISSLNEHLNNESLIKEMKWFKSKFIGELSREDMTKDWCRILLNLHTLTVEEIINNVKLNIPVLVTYDEQLISNHNSFTPQFVSDITNSLNLKIKEIESEFIENKINAKIIFILFPFESVSEMKNMLDDFERKNRNERID